MPSLHFLNALLPDGWARDVRVEIENGRVTRVTHGVPGAGTDGAIAVPGVPNLHSHAFQRGMAGLSERRGPGGDSFWTWREVMYRFLGRMNPDDVEAIAALAYMEMLEGGFTRVGEFHYLHNDPSGDRYDDPAEMALRIAAAASATGIGLTLLPVMYAHGNFGGAPPTGGQRRFLSDIDGFARLLEASGSAISSLPGAVLGVAPHSLRAVTQAQLEAVCAMLPHGPIHIHVAEQVKEVEDSLAFSGLRPVAWLLENAPLSPRWCLIHATHMTPEECRGAAGRQVVAGLCPITEASLGDGMFDGQTWTAAQGRYGFGTDSNLALDAAGEMRQLEFAQRLSTRQRNVMAVAEGMSNGRALLDHAVMDGAAALGVQGGIAPGCPADIVVLDGRHPSLCGRNADTWLDGWIFSAGGAAVRDVYVSGERVVAAGRHRARDGILAQARRVLDRLVA